jgi:uncharacterized protein (DUF1330 family)
MKYYALGEIDVTDPAWIREYVTQVTAIVQRRGGRYLARTQRTEMREGEREAPGTLVLIELPTREAALAFYDSDETALPVSRPDRLPAAPPRAPLVTLGASAASHRRRQVRS